MARLCILCELRPAELPDREQMGRPIKRVCRECHRARLRGDLQAILADRDKRRATPTSGVDPTLDTPTIDNHDLP